MPLWFYSLLSSPNNIILRGKQLKVSLENASVLFYAIYHFLFCRITTYVHNLAPFQGRAYARNHYKTLRNVHFVKEDNLLKCCLLS